MNRSSVRAPVRIDFCGGFTDVADVAAVTGTAVVNAAVDLYEDKDRTQPVDLSVELVELALGDAPTLPEVNNDELMLASLTEYVRQDIDCRRALRIHRGLPMSTGLGSSATLSVMLIAAWLVSSGRRWRDARELAELARDFECRFLGVQGGYQDFASAAAGGYHRFVEKVGHGDARTERRHLPPRFIRYFDRATFVLIAPRRCSSSEIISDVVTRLNSDPELISRLRKIIACNEQFDQAISGDDLDSALTIVEKAAELRRGISTYAANPTLDNVREELHKLYRTAHETGAGGAAIVIYGKEDALEPLERRILGLARELGLHTLFPKLNNVGVQVQCRSTP
jgi:D-glycero-alpha-D-manno-heptose-7-phosphate kinase